MGRSGVERGQEHPYNSHGLFERKEEERQRGGRTKRWWKGKEGVLHWIWSSDTFLYFINPA